MSEGVLYWPAVCGADDVFWDYQLTINTSSPRLSECFRGSVLQWVSPLYLLLASLFYLPYLVNIQQRWKRKTGLNKTKMVVSVLLALVALVNLIRAVANITQGGRLPNYAWITAAINIVTYIFVTYVIHLEFQRRVYSSGVLLFYWLFQCLLGIPPFYHYTTQASTEDIYSMVTFYISYSLCVLQLILCLRRDFPEHELSMSAEKQPLLGEHLPASPDEEEEEKVPCPENTGSFLANIYFTWIFPMIITGNKRPLTFQDMPDILERDKCGRVYPAFKRSWQRKAKTMTAITDMGSDADLSHINALPMLKTLIDASWAPFVISGVLRFFFGMTEFLNPVLLQMVIGVVGSDDPNYFWKGMVLGCVLLVFNIFQFAIAHNYFNYCTVMAMNGRTAVITAVYRKALKLSSQSRRSTTVGEIVNLMSVDAQKIYENFFDIHESWSCVLEAIVAIGYLWTIVGPSALAAVALVAIMAPISGFWMTRKYAGLQDVQMKHKDHRLKIINEILAGMKVLKMYAWEPSFNKTVDDIRDRELLALRHQAYLHGGIGIFWNCTPFLISLVVFATYVLVSPDNYLSPEVAFVSLSVINILNWATSFLPMFLGFAAQAYVSLKRITRMLLQDELDEYAVGQDPSMDEVLKITDGTFTWDSTEPDRPTLKNVNLSVREGELVAIVGTVGAGKSSLVQAALGEMHKLRGALSLRGRLAYVPQQAWIQNNTVKQNILFGKKLDESKYQDAISACALLPDLKILPGGDQTEIGEKGVNLSGGQKQRVSLARAVYQNEDIYLLDDPLSAVDAHVGKHIFDHVIGPNGLLKNKTRVLVTHGLTYLPHVDRIYVITNGQILESGRYEELMSHDGAFAEFVRTYLQEVMAQEELGEHGDAGAELLDVETRLALDRTLSQISAAGSDSLHDSYQSRDGGHSSRKTSLVRRRVSRITSRTSKKAESECLLNKEQLIEEEAAEIGTIKWAVLRDYIQSGGIHRLVLLIFFLSLYTTSMVLTNLWLSAWSDDPYQPGPEGREQTFYRLGCYAGFGALQIVSVSGQALTLYLGCLAASHVMHSRLIRRILRAPMSFFDTTPLGRIVNRFSTDMDKIDVNVPQYTRWWMTNLVQVITTIIIIVYSTPLFTAVIVPLLIIYAIVQRIYINAVRQMKRIDSIRRSPIFTNFDETLVGVASIRAYKHQERFVRKNDRLTDDSQAAYYPINVAQRFLGMVLNAIGALLVFFATVFAVLGKENITAGLAGVAITYAMQSTWSLSMMIRGATELETHVVSVERVKEYSEVEQEAPWRVEGNTPDPSWPDKGVVEFDNYSTRYRPGLDLVLKGLSFSVHQGEKLGIVGRTGAGKSSMAISLFRIIEAAGGRILVDDQDISKIGLHDLREKITVIPQDPVLFSGTLRTNLDPFGVYSDDHLWKALELAHLKNFVRGLTDGMGYECGEGGEALSVGQRQLLCLARALLRKSQVLILDEATAAVDLETDELIQTTIRSAFRDCTVLTIAHRLNTILDYDRVLVLADGEIQEYDQPTTLLKNPDSVFHGMAKDAGIV